MLVCHFEYISKCVGVFCCCEEEKRVKKETDWCSDEEERERDIEERWWKKISLWTWRGWFWLGWDRASELFFLSHRAWPLIASTYWIHQDPAANHWLRSVGPCGLAEVHFWEPETGWEEERGHYSKEKCSEKKKIERGRQNRGTFRFHCLLEKPSLRCKSEVVILVLGTW